jgi:hypothetical protein
MAPGARPALHLQAAARQIQKLATIKSRRYIRGPCHREPPNGQIPNGQLLRIQYHGRISLAHDDDLCIG